MLFLVSCTDFLDVKLEKEPTAGIFFLSDKDADDAMNTIYFECYYNQYPYGREYFYEIAGGSDDFIYGRTRGSSEYNLANFTYTGREGPLDIVQVLIRPLAWSNWMIYNLLRKETLTPVEEKRLAEARFMRAKLHFIFAYRYGRADNGFPFDRYEDYDPYIYQPQEQRATVMENYDLIIQDLEKAAAVLPFFEEYGEDDYGRAHRAAAWGYMVKTYAYWAQHDPSKWALIPPLVDRIESEGRRGLLDNFADVFTMANNWSKEYIWSINGSATMKAGCQLAGVVIDNQAWGRFNGWGFFKPVLGLYDEFAEGDLRRRVTMLEYGDEFLFFGERRRFYSTADLESGFMLAKYLEPWNYGYVDDAGLGHSPYTNDLYNDLNMPLLRHAEMVLFKAEALVMTGDGAGAARELNRLTRRAGLGDVYVNATLDDLKHERRCELAGEYADRFMDLKRWQEWDKLNAPKMGRHHYERSDPDSGWEPVEIWPARYFNPATDIVFPYNPDDIINANGKWKQNPMD